MSTRSTIAKLNPDGTVTSIYCHFDGYPDGVGATLEEHYADSTKIDQLLALGDLSILGDEIGEQVDFDSYSHDALSQCLAYGRDRGETGIDALSHMNVDGWLVMRRGSGCEYGYLRDGSEWKTFNMYGA